MSEHIELIAVLKQARYLLALPGNNFAWSGWENADAALAEIDSLLSDLQRNVLPDKQRLTLLFAPTGDIQEVSLSSGWARPFLELAERFDKAVAKCA